MAGILYVVGTPIGNLSDFSPRALETLEKCDFIAAEDTRVTLKLLNKFELKKPMVSYYEHNRRERGEMILARLLGGENCALVTDAGMPAISDPGEDLVALCHAHGVKVESVPGPTAFATAVAVSISVSFSTASRSSFDAVSASSAVVICCASLPSTPSMLLVAEGMLVTFGLVMGVVMPTLGEGWVSALLAQPVSSKVSVRQSSARKTVLFKGIFYSL